MNVRIVTQTYVALILWAVILVIIVVQNFMKKMSALNQAISIILIIIQAIVSSYVINCLVIGECHVFSWIQVFVIVLMLFFLLCPASRVPLATQ